ncbi:MAG: hypothetical protein JXP34_06750, partial [Planctomycetes bacterium]|nr:hypothetical protein [Planctomycetota bacterium]
VEKALRASAGAPVLAAALPDKAAGDATGIAAKDLLLEQLTRGLSDAHTGATDLVRLRFRDPAGAFREEIVRVLREERDGIRVQTREGVEIRLPALSVLGSEPIAPEKETARRLAILTAAEKRLAGATALEIAAGRIALVRFAAAHGLDDAARILDAILADPAFPAAARIVLPADTREAVIEAWGAAREEGTDPKAIHVPALHPLEGPIAGEPEALAAQAEDDIQAARIEWLAALPGLPEADPLLDRALRRAVRALARAGAAKESKGDPSRLARIRSAADALRTSIQRDLRAP